MDIDTNKNKISVSNEPTAIRVNANRQWTRSTFKYATEYIPGTSRTYIGPGPDLRQDKRTFESASFGAVDSQAPDTSSDFGDLNSRLWQLAYESKTETVRQFKRDGKWRWCYRLKVVWPQSVRDLTANSNKNSLEHHAESSSLKLAKETVAKKFLKDLTPQIEIQMADETPSKETVQGDVSQDSDRTGNTIVTRDQGLTEAVTPSEDTNLAAIVSSTEKISTFPDLTDRWMLLDAIAVDVNKNDGDLLAGYDLPEACYTKVSCAPNLIPYETYVYARPKLSLKFVVNANKFNCGKVLAALRFDDFACQTITQNLNSALARPHVILDLTGNNQGEMRVPFNFHRSFVRTNAFEKTNKGVKAALCVRLEIFVLSRLQTGTSGASDVDLRVFFTFENTEFAGMSYRLPLVQGDFVEDMLDQLPVRGVKRLINAAESLVDVVGGVNCDKPVSHTEQIVVPRPRLNFVSGKGLSDAVPLRTNPTTQTSYYAGLLRGDEAETALDIARIWQYRLAFDWDNNKAVDDVLCTFVPDPWSRRYSGGYAGYPTLLEYVSSCYAFASGTIDLRFDFVSNSFHTGAIVITTEFNRPSSDQASDACESYSTYSKTFHLGEQKSVSYRVPYIYDTVWRRSTMGPYQYSFDIGGSGDRANNFYLRPEFSTMVKVRVVNALRPVASAPQSIKVLVFWRAGPNFHLHSLCQAGFLSVSRTGIRNLPYQVTPTLTTVVRPKSKEYVNLEKKLAGKVTSAVSSDKLKKAEESVKLQTTRVTELESTVLMKEKDIENLNATVTKDQEIITTLESKLSAVELELDALRRSRRPRVQMDTGDKEDEDETANFNPGIRARAIQSTDNQLVLKDLFRQPVFVGHFTVSARGNYESCFVLPLRPPAINWCIFGTLSSSAGVVAQNQWDFNPGLARIPQVRLLSLYRFWRGSMRYTFVFTGVKSPLDPIYISHIPHSGADMYGNYNMSNTRFVVGPYQSGLRTVLVIPNINPTEVVEFPYDCENNWTLMYRDDTSKMANLRDMGDYNSGHLAIRSNDEIGVDLWWEGGDDFQVSNFYGMLESYSGVWDGAYSDNYALGSTSVPIVQMMDGATEDFSYLDFNDLGFEVDDKFKSIATKTAIGMIPFVGMPYNIACAVDGLERASAGVEGVTGELTDMMKILKEMLTTTLKKVDKTNDVSLVDMVLDFVLDIFIHIRTNDYVGMGISFVRSLVKHLLGNQICRVMEWGSSLGKVFSQLFSQNPSVQALSDGVGPALVGVLLAIIGTVLGVVLDPSPFQISRFLKGLVFRMTTASGVGYVAGILRITSTIFELGKRVVYWAIGETDPSIQAVQELEGKSKVLDAFVRESQLMMSEANNRLLQNPSFRRRYWVNAMQAYQIQALLTRVPNSHVSPALLQLCSKVINHSNERFIDISSSPVRYEPFVICIEGEPNLGKSFMTEYVCVELLKSIGVTSVDEPVYYRMPGSKFWSGYNNQPIVVYDDWMNINAPEYMVSQISELYQLKSTSQFIPDMAHLEDKRRRANPLVVILCTNEAFPAGSIANVSLHKEAVMRRRDIVFRVTSNKDIELVKKDNATQGVSFDHLRFQLYRSSTKKELMQKECTYTETLDWIKGMFMSHHSRQKIEVRRRLDLFEELLPSAQQKLLKYEDPFTLFYQHTARVELAALSSTPHEVLTERVLVALEELDTVEKLASEYVSEPECPFTSDLVHTQFDYIGWRDWVLRRLACPTGLLLVARWSTAKIQQLLSLIMPDSSVMVERCVQCKHEKYVYAVCRTSEETKYTPGHMVCRECYRQMLVKVDKPTDLKHAMMEQAIFSPSAMSLRCPGSDCTCHLKIIVERMIFNGVSSLKQLYLRGVITLDVFLDRVYVFTRNFIPWIQPFDKFAVFAFLAQSWVGMANPTDFIIDRGVSEWGTGWLNETFYTDLYDPGDFWDGTPNLQMSDGEDGAGEGTSRGPYKQVENVVFVSWDEIEAKKFYDSRPVLKVDECKHKTLVDHSASVRFQKQQWVVCGQEEVYVQDFPCGDDCLIVRQWPVFKNFLSIHWQLYRLKYKQQYISSRSAHLTHGNSELLSTIPHVFLPRCFIETPEVQVLIQKEIDRLTKAAWYECLTGIVYKMVKYFAIISALAATAYTMYRGILSFFGKPDVPAISPEAQAGTYTKGQSRHFQRQQALSEGVVHKVAASVQDADPMSDIYNSIEFKIDRNFFKIIIFDGLSVVRVLCATGLYGKYAILPGHYFEFLKIQLRKLGRERFRVVLKAIGRVPMQQEYTFDPADFEVAPDTDFALFRTPASWPMFTDLFPYLARDEDLYSNLKGEGKILYQDTTAIGGLEKASVNLQGTVDKCEVNNGEEVMTVCGLLVYNFSKKGACGGLVLKKNCTRPIYAMHVAGRGELTDGVGYGVLLSQEGLTSFRERFEAKMNVAVQMSEDFTRAAVFFEEDVDVEYVGVAEKIPYQSRKTKIQPSKIQSVWDKPCVTKPCYLSRDGDYPYEVSPLVAGCSKHGKKTRDFQSSVVAKCVQALWEKKFANLKPCVDECSKLTYSQACVGFPEQQFYDPLDLTTSAGYPWNQNASRGKEDFITFVRNEQLQPVHALIDVSVISEIERKSDLRKRGIVPDTIFLDTLKDERRVIEKANSLGGTRIFSMSPLDYSIALRQNFLHFYATFIEKRWSLFHAVGIDASGEEWSHLTRKLSRVGNHLVCLDYANFGPAFNAVVADGAAELMVRWVVKNVRGVDETECRVLMAETNQALHMCTNLVYRTQCGSPSGSPDTTIKNTLVNMLYLMIAWYYLWPNDNRILLWEEFFHRVEVVCYGDDVIMSVDSEAIEWYNGITISNLFREFGIVASSADKISSIKKEDTFETASFLKRSWVRHELWKGEWHGALDKRSVEECALWVWRSDNLDDATNENCRAALELAYGWGSKYFNEFRDRMNFARNKVGLDPIYFEWEDLDRVYYSSKY